MRRRHSQQRARAVLAALFVALALTLSLTGCNAEGPSPDDYGNTGEAEQSGGGTDYGDTGQG
jgi:hypothetical protein